MANIKITIDGVLMDGHEVTFKAPCDCTAFEYLDVHYVENMAAKNKRFVMKDAHGNTLTGIGNLFAAGAYVHAILNTVDSVAYLQNGDTNGYLENKFREITTHIPPYVAFSTVEEIDNWLNTVSDNIPDGAHYVRSISNNTAHRILGGGLYLLEGHKTDNNYQWQKVTSYSFDWSAPRHYERTKYAGSWGNWKSQDRYITKERFLEDGSDLNAVTESGFYRMGESHINSPSNIGAPCNYSQLIVAHGGGDTITQIIIDYSNSYMYIRSGNPSDVGGRGSWTAWSRVLTTKDIRVENGKLVLGWL